MVTLEGIVFWNNQPDREASSLVRKGVGRNTILRAVETPYPTVNPIQSNRAFICPKWPIARAPKFLADLQVQFLYFWVTLVIASISPFGIFTFGATIDELQVRARKGHTVSEARPRAQQI